MSRKNKNSSVPVHQQQQQSVPVLQPQPQIQPQQQQQQQPRGGGSSDLDQSKQWRTIYPQYINSNLTVDRGRRLSKNKCVADPTAEEIFQVLAANQQQFQVELNLQKCYCRELDKENIRSRGYIKYRILDNKQFKNKRQILQYVASMIPKLKSRQNPGQGGGGRGGGGGQNDPNSNQSGGQNKPGGGQSGGGGGKKKNRRK